MKITRVGVWFEDPAVTRRWVDELSPRLEGLSVGDARNMDPAQVEVLVVANPPGRDLERFSGLQFVQSTWAGVDRLVVDPPDGVPIARMVAPGLTRLMTEFVLTAVLFLHRDLPAYRRSQERREWNPLPVTPSTSRTVGILGYGHLGSASARMLSRIGFRVTAWARTARTAEVPVLAGEEGLERVLASSEILVDLLPLTDETRGILDRRAFDRMPPDASLVNAARGDHVVVPDLVEALDGHLGQAVLDVFPEEPLPADSPLWGHPKVTVLPHIAAPSDPGELADQVADNIRRFVEGSDPRFLVER